MRAASRSTWPRPLPEDGGVTRATERHLLEAYCEMLRWAAEIGWPTAKQRYLSREKERGRDQDGILDDLDTFEQLNLSARLKGIDPIFAQRRRDLHARLMTPIAVLAGMIVTGLTARWGAGMLPAVGAGLLTVFFGRHLGAIATILLVRR